MDTEEIRLATEKDIPSLIDFYEEVKDDNPKEFIERKLPYYIQNGFIVLVVVNGKIAGHLLFQATENPLLGVGEFETVRIHKDYQGKGLGTKLIQQSVEFARQYFEKWKEKQGKGGLYCLYLKTRSSNTAAQKIYEKAGFKPANTIGKLFLPNEPEELIMTRFFNLSKNPANAQSQP